MAGYLDVIDVMIKSGLCQRKSGRQLSLCDPSPSCACQLSGIKAFRFRRYIDLLETSQISGDQKPGICLRFQTYALPIWLASILTDNIAASVAIFVIPNNDIYLTDLHAQEIPNSCLTRQHKSVQSRNWKWSWVRGATVLRFPPFPVLPRP